MLAAKPKVFGQVDHEARWIVKRTKKLQLKLATAAAEEELSNVVSFSKSLPIKQNNTQPATGAAIQPMN